MKSLFQKQRTDRSRKTGRTAKTNFLRVQSSNCSSTAKTFSGNRLMTTHKTKQRVSFCCRIRGLHGVPSAHWPRSRQLRSKKISRGREQDTGAECFQGPRWPLQSNLNERAGSSCFPCNGPKAGLAPKLLLQGYHLLGVGQGQIARCGRQTSQIPRSSSQFLGREAGLPISTPLGWDGEVKRFCHRRLRAY